MTQEQIIRIKEIREVLLNETTALQEISQEFKDKESRVIDNSVGYLITAIEKLNNLIEIK